MPSKLHIFTRIKLARGEPGGKRARVAVFEGERMKSDCHSQVF